MPGPKLEIPKTFFDRILEIFTFLFIIASVIVIAIYYSNLPEKIPLHFNWPTKDKQGLGTKDLLWVSPIICGLIGIGIYKLVQYPWYLNYPVEVNDKNAKYHYRQATQMLRIVNLLIASLCFSVTLTSILDGLEIKMGIINYFEPLILVLLIGIPLFYVLKLSWKRDPAPNQ